MAQQTYFTYAYWNNENFEAIATVFEHDDEELVETYLNRILNRYDLQAKGHLNRQYYNYDYFRIAKIGQDINPCPGGYGPTIVPYTDPQSIQRFNIVDNDRFAEYLLKYINSITNDDQQKSIE